MNQLLEVLCDQFKVEPGILFLNAYRRDFAEEVEDYFFPHCNLDESGKVIVDSVSNVVMTYCRLLLKGKVILIKKFRQEFTEMDPLIDSVCEKFGIKEPGKIFLLAYEYKEENLNHSEVEELFFGSSVLNHFGKVVPVYLPDEVADFCRDLLTGKAQLPEKVSKNKIKKEKKVKNKSGWIFE
jgi:hypothetical protein